ncbi:MAG: hypothetical protein ACTSQY_09885 [Candidatus Odinarchaeia archaeon]
MNVLKTEKPLAPDKNVKKADEPMRGKRSLSWRHRPRYPVP